MSDQKTRYALLRAGSSWEGITTDGLVAEPDGVLTLARVPGPAEGAVIEIAGPFDVAASGLAVGPRGDLYLSDTAGGRVLWTDGVCGTRMIVPPAHCAGAVPGPFSEPRGLLLIAPDTLYVADSGNARVQVLHVPGLEARAIWQGAFQTPTGLAADSRQRVYVLDRGLGKVLRFNAAGVPDNAYNAALAAQTGLAAPTFLTIDGDDVLYVSNDADNTVWRFDTDGQFLGSLAAPDAVSGFRPRALAAHSGCLYIADAGDGRIWVYDLRAMRYVGPVAGYRGPVTALAVDEEGVLLIKPGLDEVFHQLSGRAYVASAGVVADRLDAGEQADWMRVQVQADIPAGTVVRLQFFVTDDEADVPGTGDWQEAPASDMLVPALGVLPNGLPRRRRYLWLKIDVATNDPQASPRLAQVEASTAGEDYLDYLPAIYREDAEGGFLQRWLALSRSELGDLELALSDMPGRFDPVLAPEDHLPWLAAWLGFDLPSGWDTAELRPLLLRVHDLYARRGTLEGVREFVELYTGTRPHILESFRERRLWQLGHTSALGFDTALPAALPEGMVVAGSTLVAEGDQPWGCAEPERLVVGQAVVGQSRPLANADIGEPLFSDTAHQFTVVVAHAQACRSEQQQALRRILDAEKPAHTDYHLCVVEPRMRVGFQARIGIDSIVAGPPEPMALTGSVLGLNSVLGSPGGSPQDEGAAKAGRVGQSARVGRDTILS
ncbi:MAG TPA: phage tail protein [Chloroflexia bacterium]|nr:phage tail protein [Chloroflexia bacterium]